MRNKSMLVFGLASVLALSLAYPCDKSSASAGKEAKDAAIAVESKDADSKADGGHCAKKSGAAKAKASGDPNMASSGESPNSADCPKADCDKSHCLKKHGQAKAGSAEGMCDKPQAETEI